MPVLLLHTRATTKSHSTKSWYTFSITCVFLLLSLSFISTHNALWCTCLTLQKYHYYRHKWDKLWKKRIGTNTHAGGRKRTNGITPLNFTRGRVIFSSLLHNFCTTLRCEEKRKVIIIAIHCLLISFMEEVRVYVCVRQSNLDTRNIRNHMEKVD